ELERPLEARQRLGESAQPCETLPPAVPGRGMPGVQLERAVVARERVLGAPDALERVALPYPEPWIPRRARQRLVEARERLRRAAQADERVSLSDPGRGETRVHGQRLLEALERLRELPLVVVDRRPLHQLVRVRLHARALGRRDGPRRAARGEGLEALPGALAPQLGVGRRDRHEAAQEAHDLLDPVAAVFGEGEVE